MIRRTIFTGTAQRVIRALYRLNRWATANEIARWADNMSWNTAKSILLRFYRKKIVSTKIINGRRHWMIRRF